MRFNLSSLFVAGLLLTLNAPALADMATPFGCDEPGPTGEYCHPIPADHTTCVTCYQTNADAGAVNADTGNPCPENVEGKSFHFACSEYETARLRSVWCDGPVIYRSESCSLGSSFVPMTFGGSLAVAIGAVAVTLLRRKGRSLQ